MTDFKQIEIFILESFLYIEKWNFDSVKHFHFYFIGDAFSWLNSTLILPETIRPVKIAEPILTFRKWILPQAIPI